MAFSSDTSILTGTSALYTPDAVSGVMTDIAGAHVSTTNPFVLIYETLPLKSVALTYTTQFLFSHSIGSLKVPSSLRLSSVFQSAS